MKRMVQELRALSLRAMIFCVAVSFTALAVLAISIPHIALSPTRQLLSFIVFAAAITFFMASRPVRLPGTKTVVSVSESLVFLSAILYGPYQACALGMLDGIVASRRLAKRK